ncbi:MAG: NHLP bacteriocin export ABC transporter permease/ATPase subunit [Peptostreptococcaceae bacterium]|nr:NHLP bacteriocin export ABC transporter permease/ATPase subunit [Peptostreptococcaceae bacterium]
MKKNILTKKKERQNQYIEDALYNLASVSGSRKIESDKFTDNALVKACQLVGEKMKIVIVIPNKEKLDSSKNPLDDITKASLIRYRQVAMKGDWWKMDNGPLIAFDADDNRPFALIPVSPNKYEMVDVTKGITKILDRNSAQMFKPFAYTFYRPFPSRVIGLKDLIILSFQSASLRDILMIVGIGLLGGLIGMINPIATGIVIDSVVPQADSGQLLQIGVLLLSFAIGKASFELTRSIATLRMEGRMDSFSQAAVWDRLISLPVTFFKDYTSGELAMRAMGISQIRQVLSSSTLNTIISSIFSIFNGLLIFKYDSKLALIGTGLVLIAIIVSLSLGFFQMRYERKTVEVSNKISGLVLQIIGAVSKFRVAGAEHRAFYKWAELFSVQRKIRFSKELISTALTTFNTVFPVITSIVMFYILGNYTGAKAMSTGEFLAFYASFNIFMMAMLQLSNTFLTINIILPTFESTKPILENLPEYDEEKDDPGELDGNIEIGHVTFKYNEDGPVILNDLSLKIDSGEYVALVGASGCGKSTLLRVLLGFEKPQTGKVYYSGQDLDSVDIRSVRKQLGVVLQNGQLMSGDIFSNIVGSNPNLTMKNAEEAAGMAGMAEDIKKMPMGMHTVVSEGGGTLSGGQRQRLMIARAIVNRPKILYFDEATSALDNHTQKIVSESLEELKVTRIVIAHRLSTVINCDRIIVLNKGEIAEEGTYEELMHLDGIFAGLAKRQLA